MPFPGVVDGSGPGPVSVDAAVGDGSIVATGGVDVPAWVGCGDAVLVAMRVDSVVGVAVGLPGLLATVGV